MGPERTGRLAVSSRCNSREFHHRGGQLAHVINHKRRPMVEQTRPVPQPAMASSAKADRADSGGDGVIDASWTVLDNEAALRHRRKAPCGIEEQIRRRLTTRNHRRAEQVFTEMPQETGELEFSSDLLRCAARC